MGIRTLVPLKSRELTDGMTPSRADDDARQPRLAESSRREAHVAVSAIPTEATPRVGRSRSISPLFGAVSLLIIVGVVLAFIGLRRPTAAYPLHSPQRAVQTYLDRLQSGKVDQAYRMTVLTPDYPADTSLAGFHRQWDSWSQTSHRITLVRSNQSGGLASVTVDVAAFTPTDLPSSEQTSRVTFTLERLHGTWYITGPSDLYIQ